LARWQPELGDARVRGVVEALQRQAAAAPADRL